MAFQLDLIDTTNKTFDPGALLWALEAAKIDVIGIGSYMNADPGFYFQKFVDGAGSGILVIPSVVVSTAEKSMVFVVGVVDKHVIPDGMSLEELATKVRQWGGITVLLAPNTLEEGWTLADASVVRVFDGNLVYARVSPVSLVISNARTVNDVGSIYTWCSNDKPTNCADLKSSMDASPECFAPGGGL